MPRSQGHAVSAACPGRLPAGNVESRVTPLFGCVTASLLAASTGSNSVNSETEIRRSVPLPKRLSLILERCRIRSRQVC